MTEHPFDLVAQIARALASNEQCWYRPAAIVGMGLTPVATGQCVVWVTCGAEDATTCYRFLYGTLGPLLTRLDCQQQGQDAQWPVSYWSVPGNVRDVAETIGSTWLGIPPI